MAERVLQGPSGLDPEIHEVKSDTISPAKSCGALPETVLLQPRRTAVLSLYASVLQETRLDVPLALPTSDVWAQAL